MSLPIRQRALRLSRAGVHFSIQPARPLCTSSWRQRTGFTTDPTRKYLGRHDCYRPKYPRAQIRSYASASLNSYEIRNSINIQIDGEPFDLAPFALRDMCQCRSCVDQSTRQKLFYTPDIPENIKARTVSTSRETVSVTWENDVHGYEPDHETVISMDALRRIIRTASPTPVQAPLARSLWDSQMYDRDTCDLDYESYMTDETVLFKAVKQLHTHGLLFVQNVPEDEESVVRLAERIGPLKTTFYGKTWDVRSVPDAKNVAYTSQNLGFHMDLMYMEQPPHLQLLHCIRSSSKGGASLFTDSYKAVDEIARTDVESYNTLAKLKVPYHYDHESHYYRQARSVVENQTLRVGPFRVRNWIDIVKRRAKGPDPLSDSTPIDMLASVAWSPPFQAPFALPDTMLTKGAPATRYNQCSQRWHKAAQVFNRMIHRPEAIYERLMKPGECVIFDNRRVLHARSAFDVDDVGKERWLRGAYIDKDPYVSKLKLLREKFEGAEH